MLGGNAQGVWSALGFRAGVHARSEAFAKLEADFCVGAMGVAAALVLRSAARSTVFGVSNITRWTAALSVVANGFRPTSHRLAKVTTLSAFARIPVGTQKAIAALAIFWFPANSSLDLAAHDKRVPGISFLASAIVAADCVDANGAVSAHVVLAFVDIFALDVGVAGETMLASAFDPIESVQALSVGAASGRRASLSVLYCFFGACFVGVSNRTDVADALVGDQAVFAMGVFATFGLTRRPGFCCNTEMVVIVVTNHNSIQ